MPDFIQHEAEQKAICLQELKLNIYQQSCAACIQFMLLPFQEQIEEEAKKPVGEKMAALETNVDMRSQSISQTIYAENRVSSGLLSLFTLCNYLSSFCTRLV
jgi:hypothetical protein